MSLWARHSIYKVVPSNCVAVKGDSLPLSLTLWHTHTKKKKNSLMYLLTRTAVLTLSTKHSAIAAAWGLLSKSSRRSLRKHRRINVNVKEEEVKSINIWAMSVGYKWTFDFSRLCTWFSIILDTSASVGASYKWTIVPAWFVDLILLPTKMLICFGVIFEPDFAEVVLFWKVDCVLNLFSLCLTFHLSQSALMQL